MSATNPDIIGAIEPGEIYRGSVEPIGIENGVTRIADHPHSLFPFDRIDMSFKKQDAFYDCAQLIESAFLDTVTDLFPCRESEKVFY